MFETLENYANIIIEFVKAHQGWAPLVVFLLAFGESLAFISLLLPAWAALIGIGTVIMAGGLNFWPIWIAASLGAAMRRLAVLLDRQEARTHGAAHLAAVAAPGPDPEGRGLHEEMGRRSASSSGASSDRCAPRCR